jgi:Uma2 family endonuclease
MLTREHAPITEAEYLRLEAQSPVRHEYVNGEMFAMTGTSLRHNVIALNITSALRTHLRSTPCRVFMSDVRVRVRVTKDNAYYYPDVVVSCGAGVQALDLDSYTVEDPLLIVEVLSTNTEATDRREKLLAYRSLSTLKEYILVSQGEARVEIHRRRGDIGWELIEYSGPERVEFVSAGVSLDMREIYEGVPIEALTRGPA